MRMHIPIRGLASTTIDKHRCIAPTNLSVCSLPTLQIYHFITQPLSISSKCDGHLIMVAFLALLCFQCVHLCLYSLNTLTYRQIQRYNNIKCEIDKHAGKCEDISPMISMARKISQLDIKINIQADRETDKHR